MPHSYALEEPSENYHAHPATSRGKLALFLERRRRYKARYIDGTDADDKDNFAMQFGSLAHKVLLEDVALADAVEIIPESILVTKAGTAAKSPKATDAYKAFVEHAGYAGKVALLQAEYDEQKRVLEAVLANPFIKTWMLRNCYRERSIYWKSRNGLDLRCRPDWWFLMPSENIVFDFKFTVDASPSFVANRINDDYWLQEAMYSDGVTELTGLPTSFFFLFVERGPAPYVAAYQSEAKATRDNDHKYRAALASLEDCTATGNFAEPWEGTINVVKQRYRNEQR